jgi:hypothetical protein
VPLAPCLFPFFTWVGPPLSLSFPLRLHLDVDIGRHGIELSSISNQPWYWNEMQFRFYCLGVSELVFRILRKNPIHFLVWMSKAQNWYSVCFLHHGQAHVQQPLAVAQAQIRQSIAVVTAQCSPTRCPPHRVTGCACWGTICSRCPPPPREHHQLRKKGLAADCRLPAVDGVFWCTKHVLHFGLDLIMKITRH